jgi:hypothetical protein
MNAEASMRELQSQSVADKAITENKLISLGNSLVTLKTSLTQLDTSVQPSHSLGENGGRMTCSVHSCTELSRS